MSKRPTVEMSDAMAELAAWAGVEEAEAVEFDIRVMQRAALEGLAGLLFLARRNDPTACRYLVDRWMGEPILPFGERTKTMTREEVRAEFIQRWQQAWGWTDEEASAMWDRYESRMSRRRDDDGDEG